MLGRPHTKERSKLPTQFNIKLPIKSFLNSSVCPKGSNRIAGPTELISASSISFRRGEGTYQAFSGEVIARFRMTEALTGFTDAAKDGAVNSPVPRPTRLKKMRLGILGKESVKVQKFDVDVGSRDGGKGVDFRVILEVECKKDLVITD